MKLNDRELTPEQVKVLRHALETELPTRKSNLGYAWSVPQMEYCRGLVAACEELLLIVREDR